MDFPLCITMNGCEWRKSQSASEQFGNTCHVFLCDQLKISDSNEMDKVSEARRTAMLRRHIATQLADQIEQVSFSRKSSFSCAPL